MEFQILMLEGERILFFVENIEDLKRIRFYTKKIDKLKYSIDRRRNSEIFFKSKLKYWLNQNKIIRIVEIAFIHLRCNCFVHGKDMHASRKDLSAIV